jgi:hypothetical protein
MQRFEVLEQMIHVGISVLLKVNVILRNTVE